MNILMINYEYPPIGAGAANATHSMANCFVKKGHRVTVFTSSFGSLRGLSRENGIDIFRIPSLRKKAAQSNIIEMLSFLISGLVFLPMVIRRQKIDAAIVFFSFPCGPLGLWGKIIGNVPYVISLRGGDVPGNEASLDRIHKLLSPLRRMIFKHGLSVVANSDGLKKLSEKADPYPVVVIPNGIDTLFFHSSPRKKQNKPCLLFVGRFQEQKNLAFFLEQMDIVYQKTGVDFQLNLVGDGPLREPLGRLVEALACRDKILFHGWCDKLRLKRFYEEAHFLINPSFCEGMSNVVLEALACGCPVIASNVPGHKEIIHHRKTGFLFDLEKPETFQELLTGVLRGVVTVQIQNAPGTPPENHFVSWEDVSGRYLDILRHLERGRVLIPG